MTKNRYSFDLRGIHKETGTLYDENGFDRNGIHILTWDRFDLLGMDKDGNKIASKTENLSKIVGSKEPKKRQIVEQRKKKPKKIKRMTKRKRGQEVIDKFT